MDIWTAFALFTATILMIFSAMCVWLAYYRLDEMEAHLKGSPLIFSYSRGAGSLTTRTLRLGTVARIILLPKLHVRRKVADAREIEMFPVALRRWIYCLGTGYGMVFGCMMIFWIAAPDHPPNF